MIAIYYELHNCFVELKGLNLMSIWFCHRVDVRCKKTASAEEVNGRPGPAISVRSSKQRIANYHVKLKHKAKFI